MDPAADAAAQELFRQQAWQQYYAQQAQAAQQGGM